MNSTKELWSILKVKAGSMQQTSLKELFENNPQRAQRLAFDFDSYHLDVSKQFIDDELVKLLFKFAENRGLRKKIQTLINGGVVNITENRPALHTALRLPKESSLYLNGKNVVDDVQHSINKMEGIVKKVHGGYWRGYSGKAITDIVNIGVGGSDLGPFMVVNALKEFRAKTRNKLDFHFVSSMDGTQVFKLLDNLNPETTLFVISSKSFTTVDTFYNANTAMEWMLAKCEDKELILKQHFIGVSADEKKMTTWGIVEDNQLKFWEWVGGRFSLWCAIGLPVALSIGMHNFKNLLAGAHAMDEHFSNSDMSCNLPIILGLVGVWNATFLEINAHTVLPYDGRLQFFPNYLTQLEMESNGKAVDNNGVKVSYPTCPILWGDIGPNAQHAFYQLLHQGTQRVSCDFIAPIKRYHDNETENGADEYLLKQHKLALANCLAQSRVLAFGNNAISDTGDMPAHKFYKGNQPSTTLLINELNPYTLGGLVALYEHKVYVMAALWDINPFDQWGVELGKVIANEILQKLDVSESSGKTDSSTEQLLSIITNKA